MPDHSLVRPRWGLALALVPLVAACELKTDCTISGVYGVQVAVVDSTSLEAIADSAFGTLAGTGGYLDTLSIIEFNIEGRPWRLGGAIDRPGTYDVFLRRIGYYDWEAKEVPVGSNACGVQPVHLQARMCRVGIPACDSAYAP